MTVKTKDKQIAHLVAVQKANSGRLQRRIALVDLKKKQFFFKLSVVISRYVFGQTFCYF